ncbi:hypothetical protein J6590_101003 [Homalodisca vitripennis]|nr:hypothetical protein J6590_101003 [Homalodisca vitripennis]
MVFLRYIFIHVHKTGIILRNSLVYLVLGSVAVVGAVWNKCIKVRSDLFGSPGKKLWLHERGNDSNDGDPANRDGLKHCEIKDSTLEPVQLQRRVVLSATDLNSDCNNSNPILKVITSNSGNNIYQLPSDFIVTQINREFPLRSLDLTCLQILPPNEDSSILWKCSNEIENSASEAGSEYQDDVNDISTFIREEDKWLMVNRKINSAALFRSSKIKPIKKLKNSCYSNLLLFRLNN